MKIKWHREARKEFLKLKDDIQDIIKTQKDKLAVKGLKWDKVSPLMDPEIGLEAFRLRVDQGEVNHRMIFDVTESCFLILKVGERPGFYDKENLGEAKGRK